MWIKIPCILISTIKNHTKNSKNRLPMIHCDYYWLLKVFYSPKKPFDLPQRWLFFLQKYFPLKQYSFPIVFHISIISKLNCEKFLTKMKFSFKGRTYAKPAELMQKHTHHLSRSYLTFRGKKIFKKDQAICPRPIFSF